MTYSPLVWENRDDTGGECVLEWSPDHNEWQFSVTEGPFSGYPTVNVNRESLERLREAIDKQLSDKKPE